MARLRPRTRCCFHYFVIAACVAGLAGCSRLRGSNRYARRAAPQPAAPVITEGDESLPVMPRSSAYGPVPGVSVAPRGSTGFSRDIRYPRNRDLVLQPGPISRRPVPKRSNGIAPLPELPIDVPAKRSDPAAATNGATTAPDSTSTRDEAPGIPNFSVVEHNIAVGGQPTYEGMEWLKERGFRTVLNLSSPDSADPAEAALVRQLGLEYIELAITAETIQADTVGRFNQIVDDEKVRPVFIHDSTGSRTGAMWFLHRVTVDGVPHDRARDQAGRIGLQDTDTDLWLAINRYLSERP